MRQTKIVATLGPATDSPEVLDALIEAGLDVARVNFSHGDPDQHRQRVQMVREAAARHGLPIGILSDLQGPKIRLDRFIDASVDLKEGDAFILDVDHPSDAGTAKRVGVTYKKLPGDLSAGDTLLLDDGNIVLAVTKIDGGAVHTIVVTGGPLSDSKGLNRRGGGLSAAIFTDKDLSDIKLAAELDIDYLAISFARNAADIEQARRLLHNAGGKAAIMAKIERAEALDNLEEIVIASDAVMVARGDLGVEVGNAELPGVQKRIFRAARRCNCVTVTATQMMQSMIEASMPTRAEVLDVANAVLDGTDAVMLSAETAVGKHPAKVVDAMRRICEGAERQGDISNTYQRDVEKFDTAEEAIATATMFTAHRFGVSAIIALTESGNTARWMSRELQDLPIYAVTPLASTARRCSLFRGVHPVNHTLTKTDDLGVDQEVLDELKRRNLINPGARVMMTKGDRTGVSGGTNTMKILKAGGA